MKTVSGHPRLRGLIGIGLVVSAGALACQGGSGAAAALGGSDAAADGGDAGPLVAAPDLRFKWVGSGFSLKLAPFEVAGGVGQPVRMHGQAFWSALPLTGAGVYGSIYTFKAVENLETMNGLMTKGPLSNIQADVNGLLDGRGIYTSLDSGYSATDRGYVYDAMSITTESNSTTYLPFERGALPPEGVADWTAFLGARGLVVTALCPQASDADGGTDGGADGAADAGGGAGLVYATAYGRQGDTATYETQVAIAPLEALSAQLDAMAASGYIVTALGRDGTVHADTGNFIVVGTRVAGQTSPRAIKLVDVPCVVGAGELGVTALETLLADGYALVGEIYHGTGECNGSPSWAFIAER